eukprot:14668166-Alexandrium_andersonii.AAC.1
MNERSHGCQFIPLARCANARTINSHSNAGAVLLVVLLGPPPAPSLDHARMGGLVRVHVWQQTRACRAASWPVSYTHLTLPTICSV